MLKSISELVDILDTQTVKRRLVLCAAADDNALDAVYRAYKKNIIEPILVGNKEDIKDLCTEMNFDFFDKVEIINVVDPKEMVKTSVSLIHNGKADFLMKGHISTAELMRGVLNKEWGLKKRRVISHFALFDLPAYHKPLALTDVAMNIAPDLETKIGILNNAIEFMRKVGVKKPKVAALAAVEMVNEKMQATLDAALLTIMANRGQIRHCEIDGPLAFDNAISQESSSHKGIKSTVAGDADLLLVPDIEAGNVLYKAFVFFANAKVASIILGAKAPIVLTSRADSMETKLNSIRLAAASIEL
ncbi:bifunctional enoyl-CoA hydratase/phosphate acetyltransferase [Flammeovirga kamogawensis]|uniref:Bifunctional enoyl-CoA hydratase/phosphate acetyltransferase n=1 Tax=Flammeovirga kamogawensis TaxID=373891 RepID=A0ABX8GTY4_9BACT|nr:bifunctional enoyl-CoA hydratase/phosphate acetyltransferase [Flammeovirga kamogawensis]MBB6462511.1 phosphate butyryltransferase [Flammeovirga kamogawensis]QWG06752.1 bifunctional enoyl-CoA hydratase/phosphate acetyltransferase [Flammeovirga kamogawensis]TRX68575.1 bifunctional enoyl-CoA hydratase/phosphate acetyltransferase [Flammeovirga kamogawensis]